MRAARLAVAILVAIFSTDTASGLAAAAATQPEGYILGPEEGTRAVSHLIKVEPARGASRLGLGTQRLRAGRSIPLHIHDGEDEVLYILSGRGVGVVGRIEREVETGSLLYVPQGAWHGVSAFEEMAILWVVSPPEFAAYLRESEEAGGAAMPEERWREIAAKHQYVDTPQFLQRLLAGTRWELAEPLTLVIFDDSGLSAEIRGAVGKGTLEIHDSLQGSLSFVGTWSEAGAATPQKVTLEYDFAGGEAIEVRWSEGQRTATLRRAN
jgi:quercetin dioxygenase-like cupin family protein